MGLSLLFMSADKKPIARVIQSEEVVQELKRELVNFFVITQFEDKKNDDKHIVIFYLASS